MFYNFNAHREAKPVKEPASQPARKIFSSLIKVQRMWANCLNRQAGRMSLGWLQAICVTVIAASCLYSAWLIGQGFSSIKNGGQSAEQPIWFFDPYGLKEQVRSGSKLDTYLDSLENAVIKDSLYQLNHFEN